MTQNKRNLNKNNYNKQSKSKDFLQLVKCSFLLQMYTDTMQGILYFLLLCRESICIYFQMNKVTNN